MNQSIFSDLHRFYLADATVGQSFIMSDEDHKHLKVLRMQSGDQVHIINGKGALFLASINPSKRSTEVQIEATHLQEETNPNNLILAIAPTKNIARLEWVIEKATEVGVKAIVPIQCEHSERVHLKLDRLERIMVSAMKQSKALWATELHELAHFNDFLNISAEEKLIAHCIDGIEKKELKSLINKVNSRVIAIGPEGDFSLKEVEQASKNGFKSLSLGEKRLRTETAAIAACIAAQMF